MSFKLIFTTYLSLIDTRYKRESFQTTIGSKINIFFSIFLSIYPCSNEAVFVCYCSTLPFSKLYMAKQTSIETTLNVANVKFLGGLNVCLSVGLCLYFSNL